MPLLDFHNLITERSIIKEENNQINQDIRARIKLQSEANQEFLAKIKEDYASITDKEEAQKFYQNSLSTNPQNLKKIYFANLELIASLMQDYPDSRYLRSQINKLFAPLGYEFGKISSQNNLVAASQVKKDMEEIYQQAAKDAEQNAADKEQKFQEKLPLEILEVMDELSSKNQIFINEVERKSQDIFNIKDHSKLSEETRVFYNNSMLTGEKNLKQIILTNLEVSYKLSLKYPDHEESIEIIKLKLLKYLDNNFSSIFGNPKSVAYYHLHKRKLREYIDKEFKIEQTQLRQTNRQALFSDAEKIRAATNGSMRKIKQGELDKDFRAEKEKLNAEIQNLKNDIYLLTDLRFQAKDENEQRFIDQNTKNLLNEYEKVADKGSLVRNTYLQRNSKSYNFIMNRSEDTIARMMHDLRKQSTENTIDKTDFNTQQFLENAPPEVVLKINNIQRKIEQRAELETQGQTGGIIENIGKFFNLLKTIVGRGVSNDDLINLHKDMIEESKQNVIINKKFEAYPELAVIKGSLEKFIDRKATNENQVTSQIHTNKVEAELSDNSKKMPKKDSAELPSSVAKIATTEKAAPIATSPNKPLEQAEEVKASLLPHVTDPNLTTPKKAVEVLKKLRENKISVNSTNNGKQKSAKQRQNERNAEKKQQSNRRRQR